MRVVKPRNRDEAIIQEHVVKLLKAYGRHDIEWHCVPNGAVLPWKVAKELRAMGVIPGVGDIMLLIDAASHALELKTEAGEQSADQEAWQEQHERAGGYYHLAFGLDEAIGILMAINAFRPNIQIQSSKPVRTLAPA